MLFRSSMDADEPGECLKLDLFARLGKARCFVETRPDGSKDANDILLEHGADELERRRVSAEAAMPLLFDVPSKIDEPPLEVYETGWSQLDPYLKYMRGGLVVVTGNPNAGKSQWVLGQFCQLARVHGMRCAYLGMEGRQSSQKRDIQRYAKSWSGRMNMPPEAFQDKFFRFPRLKGRVTIELIKDAIMEVAKVHRCTAFCIDPWSKLVHEWGRNMQEYQYVDKTLAELQIAAAAADVTLFIVAHPTNAATKANATIDDWGLEAIAGGSAWHRNADHGIVVFKPNNTTERIIKVCKNRDWEIMGTPGEVLFEYDRVRSVYVAKQ